MTRAMLLCAGYGTRLGALSDERPKPMLPVCGLPILRFGIALLVGHGVRDIVINLHHRGDVIEREIGTGTDLGARIHYIREHEILGTGGGLKHALHLLDPDGTDEPFLSLNGKLIFDVDLHGLVAAFAAAPADTLGMMVVHRVPDALEWGAVDVDESGPMPQVRNILGTGQHMFCGVHVTRPSVVRRLPDGEACMVRQGYLPWIQAGGTVAGFEHQGGYFAEHSTPARYLQSNFDLLEGAALRFAPGPLAGVDAGARVHPSATLRAPVRVAAGAEIGAGAVVGPHAVVGENARVAANARIERCVVWAGAQADGALHDCIVTPGAVVPAD